jgi:hypothetical protein
VLDYKTLLRYSYGSDAEIAPVDTPPPSIDDVTTQATADLVVAQCWSDSFGRPVPLGSCVQSASSRAWYQCQPSGVFTPSTMQSGESGACTNLFGL